jgi:YggT family protein
MLGSCEMALAALEALLGKCCFAACRSLYPYASTLMIVLINFLNVIVQLSIQITIWLVFISAIASWLIAFNVINMQNMTVRQILTMLNRIIEPLCRPIRRFMPDLGGIDLSPLVLVIILIATNQVLVPAFFDFLRSIFS